MEPVNLARKGRGGDEGPLMLACRLARRLVDRGVADVDNFDVNARAAMRMVAKTRQLAPISLVHMHTAHAHALLSANVADNTFAEKGPIAAMGISVADDPALLSRPGTCRVCGCDEDNACILDEEQGGVCEWTDDTRTLCSGCAPRVG
jgi:hypothetical protein